MRPCQPYIKLNGKSQPQIFLFLSQLKIISWYHWKIKNIPNNARGTVVENKPSISYKTKTKWIRFIIFCETNDRDTKSIKQK